MDVAIYMHTGSDRETNRFAQNVRKLGHALIMAMFADSSKAARTLGAFCILSETGTLLSESLDSAELVNGWLKSA